MLKYLSRSDSQDANMQKLQIANKWATETILYTYFSIRLRHLIAISLICMYMYPVFKLDNHYMDYYG